MPLVIGKPSSATVCLALVMLGGLMAAGAGLAVALAGRGKHKEPPAYAVIYARERYLAKTNNEAIDLYWQSLPSGTPRVIYTIPPDNYTPRSVGYLPSPDGRWLYVWHNLPTATRFFLVSVPDGKVVPVAEAKSYPSSGYGRFVLALAPVWLDSNRLLLETSFGSAIFDLRTRKLTKPLPPWPPKSLPAVAYRYTTLPTPEAFVREHYGDDLQCAKQGLAKFSAELGLKDYLAASFEPETLESMLARPLWVTPPEGLPGAGGATLTHPELACSPNHRYLARAAVLPTDAAIQRKDLRGNWQAGRQVAIRLDFFDLTGRDQFAGEVQNVLPGVLAREGKPFRAFSQPHLGDLRFSPDGRFFTYTIYGIAPPYGHPNPRIGTVKVQGRADGRFPTTGVYIRDSWWAAADPEQAERQSRRYEWLYFIPDAFNAFVVLDARRAAAR